MTNEILLNSKIITKMFKWAWEQQLDISIRRYVYADFKVSPEITLSKDNRHIRFRLTSVYDEANLKTILKQQLKCAAIELCIKEITL